MVPSYSPMTSVFPSWLNAMRDDPWEYIAVVFHVLIGTGCMMAGSLRSYTRTEFEGTTSETDIRSTANVFPLALMAISLTMVEPPRSEVSKDAIVRL